MTDGARLEVMFVDDEPQVVSGLRRQFHGKRKVWDVRTACSGDDAIAKLEERPADIVVSDMRMPGMSGATLLKQVRERWPSTVRLILSGQTDQAELLQDIGAIHQFLQKPCPPEQIEKAIDRTRELAMAVESAELRSVVSKLKSLPVISKTYTELLAALDDEECELETVSEIIERDVGLATKLLQMVNSAFFGLPRHVEQVKDAVSLVGLMNIRFLALTTRVFDALSSDDKSGTLIASLWEQSIRMGSRASDLAMENGQPREIADAARLAGTVSLIGRAVLIRHGLGQYRGVQRLAAEEGITLSEAETRNCRAPHSAIGAYALGLWAFNDNIVESVLRLECPSQSAVTTAEHPLAYAHMARASLPGSGLLDEVKCDTAWLESIGIDGGLAIKLERAA